MQNLSRGKQAKKSNASLKLMCQHLHFIHIEVSKNDAAEMQRGSRYYFIYDLSCCNLLYVPEICKIRKSRCVGGFFFNKSKRKLQLSSVS